VDDVGQHGRGEIQAEHMYFGVQALFDQPQHPSHHIILKINFHYAVFHTAFLQYGQTESLRHASIILLLQNLYS